jgi:hypothetical protein
MNEEDPHHESLEEKLREMARQLGRSIERAVEDVDLEEIAERVRVDSERMKEFAELASRWLGEQFPPSEERESEPEAQADRPRQRRTGPHPLDIPTEEQGLALSGLGSGRWRVESGTNVLIDESQGPGPTDAMGVVGELRARDWITADGQLTLIGEDALRRWLASTDAS